MSAPKVFQLQPILDDQIHEGFGSPEGDPPLPESLPSARSGRQLQMRRLAGTWTAPRVIGRVRRFNDFPSFGTRPVFSSRAVEALGDFLRANGELLPLRSELGTYFYLNVTTIADVLDCERSDVAWSEKYVDAIRIKRYEFLRDRLDTLTIFTIPQSPCDLFVTERFVGRAEQRRLRGMDFRLIWPLAEGVSWRQLAQERKRQHLSAGLPAGQSVKGNAVIIRLFLSSAASTGTPAERAAVLQMERELNAMFYDPASDAPSVGWLEGYDFGVAGECRVILSSPDADALMARLRPWLRTLRWRSGFEVYKRYAGPYDDGAEEVRLQSSDL